MAGVPRPARSGWTIALLAGVIGALIGALAMSLASGRMVRSYLLDHPEVIPEAMERLQDRQAGAAVSQHRAALETPFHGAWAGAADGDVVLVEFFDYACGFCRAANPHVERLLREDPRLKVVWREFPVLGPASEQAAVASLAAARSGRFRQYFESLFQTARPSEATIAAAARAAGIAPAQLTPEFRSEIQKNLELGAAIGARGTPTFVVGNQVLHGAVGYEVLRDAVAEARASRG